MIYVVIVIAAIVIIFALAGLLVVPQSETRVIERLGKFHKVLAKHILEPYTEDEQELLLGLVKEVDDYLNTQVARYDNNDKIRQTAKDVAKDARRRKNDD